MLYVWRQKVVLGISVFNFCCCMLRDLCTIEARRIELQEKCNSFAGG